MSLSNINIKIGANLDSFRTSMQKIERQMQKTGAKLQSIGTKMSIGITVPILAIGTASLKAASDAEETFSKFDTVFRDVAKSANDSFETLRNEYGLSSRAAKQLLGDTGDLLTGFGFSQEAALDLSTEVNKLAVDLASFTNYAGGAEGASEALTKALLGERESVKALGIAILEEDVNKQMAINTAKGLTFETERQAKAQATLDLAIQQSTNAIGDYARTSESFANQSRLLRARLEDLSQELGKVLLPLATKIVTKLKNVAEAFSSLDGQTQKNIVVFGALAASIGPLMVGLGTLMKTLPLITAGFTAMTGPIGISIAIIGALTAGLIASNQQLSRFSEEIHKIKQSQFDENFKETKKEIDELVKKFKEINPSLTQAEAIEKAVNAVSNSYRNLSSTALKNGNLTVGQLNEILARIKSYKNQLLETAKETEKLGDTSLEAFSKIADEKNKEVFSKWERDTAAFNTELEYSLRLQEKLNSLTGNEFDKTGIQDFDLGLSGPPVIEIPQIDESSKTAFILSLKELSNSASQVINDGIINSFVSMSDAIGTALANGASVMKAAGSALLGSLATMLGQLGEMAIATGVAVMGIKIALESLNPIAAIAAGVALIALSSLVKGRMKSLSSNGSSGGGALGMAEGVPARAMGGSVQSGVPYLVGERGPELFTPSGYGSISNARQTAVSGVQEILVKVESLLQGADIYQSGQAYARIQGRTT